MASGPSSATDRSVYMTLDLGVDPVLRSDLRVQYPVFNTDAQQKVMLRHVSSLRSS